jgi:hypothetical protein
MHFGGHINPLLVAGVVGAGAVVLAMQATALPTFSLGNSVADVVEIWSSVEGDEVWLSWELSPSGDVDVHFGRVPHDGSTSILESAEIFLVLACDTRLDNIHEVDVYGSNPSNTHTVDSLGDPAGCQPLDEPIGLRELEYQLIRTTLMRDEVKQLSGTPIADWSVRGGGIRSARTPNIMALSDINREHFPALSELEVISPERVTLKASLTAAPEEVVDHIAGPGGKVLEQTSNDINDWGEGGQVASVQWSLEATKPDGLAVVGPGVAQWTDHPAKSIAEWLLLLSGVMLGVAVSLIVDHLLPRTEVLRT